MATVKVKYRPSVREEKEGTIYYQIIHNRVIRQIRTDYRIFREEWDSGKHAVTITTGGREAFLRTVKDSMARDLKRLNTVIDKLGSNGGNFTADDVVTKFQEPADEPCFSGFMEEVIARLERLGKTRTSETYTAALNSFMRFREGRDIPLDEISPDLMEEYEAYLKGCGVSLNTVSFYNRILRAAYNRAVEKGLTPQRHPFRNVYTGMEKTVKRAIPFEAVRRIKGLDLSLKPAPDFARDMFLFSFYTRGMSFVDMAYLRKSDLKNGILSYRRKKTGQQLHIRWERCMGEIVEPDPMVTTAARDNRSDRFRKAAVRERPAPCQPQVEEGGGNGGYFRSTDDVCRAPCLGEHCQKQEHPAVGHQRGHGARFGDDHANLSRLPRHFRDRRGERADSQ